MSAGSVAGSLSAALVMAWTVSGLMDTGHAAADPCADVDVVVARATDEPPGLGFVGQSFVNALRPKVSPRSLDVYAVNYPASGDLVGSASVGADDALAHVRSTVANCPNTRIVLAGYSRGATVTDLTTERLPPEAADHVAAIAVFGNPQSTRIQRDAGSQLPTINPLYRSRTIDLCFPEDPICSEGTNDAAHVQYVPSGMTDQAATFVAQRL
jgi:cutinase